MDNTFKKTTDVVVIGAGLTGLTTAYWLSRQGVSVHVVERHPFVGGQIHPEMLSLSDDQVKSLVTDELHEVLRFPRHATPDMIHISRHEKAIPQYELSSTARLLAVQDIQEAYPGLIIAGNLRDGIGMGHRMTQASHIAQEIVGQLKSKP